MNEDEFQGDIRATPWFKEFTARYGAEPNLNDPNYDYRKAMGAGYRPTVRDPGDQLLHWPSQFKGENHPNRFVDGMDTMTGRPSGRPVVPPQAPRSQVWGPPVLPEASPPPPTAGDLSEAGGWPAMGALAAQTEGLTEGPNVGMWPTPRPARPLEEIPDRRGVLGALAETQLSPGLPAANRAAATAERLADRYIIPKTPSDYAGLAAGGVGGKAIKTAILAAGNVLDPEEAKAGKATIVKGMGKILAPGARDIATGLRVMRESPIAPSELQKGIKAYHSSPHDFEKFDIGKIGTGEGAQVYGHGLYFAENPKVSGQGGEYWKQFLRRFPEETPERWAAEKLQKSGFDRESTIAQSAKDIEELKRFLSRHDPQTFGERLYHTNHQKLLAEKEAIHERLISGQPVGPRTYEVNIHADPAQMLDWDKPLREQPQIWEGLHKAGHGIPKRLVTPEDLANLQSKYGDWGKMQAAALKDLPDKPGSEFRPFSFEQSQKMAEAGIPGIKYLDEGSRMPGPSALTTQQLQDRLNTMRADLASGRGSQSFLERQISSIENELERFHQKPTSNYVVFDPSIVDIMKKYGIAGAAAPTAMGALAAQDDYR